MAQEQGVKTIIDLRQPQKKTPKVQLTPLDRAKLISQAAFEQSGFRPRYVLIDGVVVDTEKPVDIPLRSLFPNLKTSK